MSSHIGRAHALDTDTALQHFEQQHAGLQALSTWAAVMGYLNGASMSTLNVSAVTALPSVLGL